MIKPYPNSEPTKFARAMAVENVRHVLVFWYDLATRQPFWEANRCFRQLLTFEAANMVLGACSAIWMLSQKLI